VRKRTLARDLALKFLYQIDITRDAESGELEFFWQNQEEVESSVKEFAETLIKGVAGKLDEIDKNISRFADNWELRRMAVVDRNILRLGTFELLYRHDVPPTVCINEAIELAKRFGDAESAKFINGILDAIYKAHARTDASSPASPSPGTPLSR